MYESVKGLTTFLLAITKAWLSIFGLRQQTQIKHDRKNYGTDKKFGITHKCLLIAVALVNESIIHNVYCL